jgi:putative FmdB family regulatory protein
MVIAMPTYVFRCEQHCPDFTEQYPMAAVPEDSRCPRCAGRARRKIGAPALSVGNSAAMRLQDCTRATADDPGVVRTLPPGDRPARVTTNPLHRRLPRP